MYHFWRQHPLLRPAIGLAFGILLSALSDYRLVLAAGGLVSLLFLLARKRTPFLTRRVRIYPVLVFAVIGYLHHKQISGIPESRFDRQHYLARVSSAPKASSSGYSCTLKLLVQNTANTGWEAIPDCRVMAFFYQDSLAGLLLPGDELLFDGKPDTLSAPLNPYTFDYARYLRKKSIHYRLFLKEGNWEKLEHPGPQPLAILLLRRATLWRNSVLEQFRKAIPGEQERAVLEALVCGYTEDLDPETRSRYALSGTLHILAVSGMHVGILLLICMKLLSPIGNLVMRNLLLLLLLWMYAWITGLSPSVLRAVCMASLYLVGETINRRHSTWNALAFALIVLLSYDPHFLFSPGFQLSFLALSGILLGTGKALNRKKSLREKLRGWLYGFLRASLSAQVFTAPLSLYYFHLFPTWFLVGNLLIVPLAAPLFYSGLLVLLLAPFPFLQNLAGLVAEKLVQLCLFLAKQIAQLPMASLDAGGMREYSVWGLYGILILLVLFFKLRQKKALTLALLCACLLVLFSSLHTLENRNASGLILYAEKRSERVEYYSGGKVFLVSGGTQAVTEAAEAFHRARQLEQAGNGGVDIHPWGLSFRGSGFFLLRMDKAGTWRLHDLTVPTYILPPDTASGSFLLPPNSTDFCNIVLSGKHDFKSRKYWKEEAKRLGVKCLDLMETGALIVEE